MISSNKVLLLEWLRVFVAKGVFDTHHMEQWSQKCPHGVAASWVIMLSSTKKCVKGFTAFLAHRSGTCVGIP